MDRLHISRFTTRVLTVWSLLLALTLITLTVTHIVTPNPISFHALSLDGFLASLLMGLRVIVCSWSSRPSPCAGRSPC
jgi:hypothetical protein